MADLRSVLLSTTMEAASIQRSASSMMKLYDTSPQTAVTEWRNSLRSCQPPQLLPLLYVANEVLQTSKRNRGTKFLECYGPILGSSLRYICERNPVLVEKVRRTTKIWGDRRVFSMRFIGELLGGLEKYRPGAAAAASPVPLAALPPPAMPPPQMTAIAAGMVAPPPVAARSPPPVALATPAALMATPGGKADATTATAAAGRKRGRRGSDSSAPTVVTETSTPAPSSSDPEGEDEEEEEEEEEGVGEDGKREDDDDDDDDEDADADDDSPFGGGGRTLLNVDLKIDKSQLQMASKKQAALLAETKSKRRRLSADATGGADSAALKHSLTNSTKSKASSSATAAASLSSLQKKKKKRQQSVQKRPLKVTTNGLVELLEHVATLQQGADAANIAGRPPARVFSDNPNDIMDVVGDELLDLCREVAQATSHLRQERHRLHGLATEVRAAEQTIRKSFYPFLQTQNDADSHAIEFCNRMERQLLGLQLVQGDALAVREKRRDEEATRRALEEAQRRRKAEEEELKQSLQKAMQKETESKPGMVWNPNTRSYQERVDHVDDSWRD